MIAAINRAVPRMAPSSAAVSGMLSTTGRCTPRLAVTIGDNSPTSTPRTSRHRNNIAQNA